MIPKLIFLLLLSPQPDRFLFFRICETLRYVWRWIINFFNRSGRDDTDSSLKRSFRCIFGLFRRSSRTGSVRKTKNVVYPRLDLPANNLHFEYNMTHRRRGVAMIFNHEVFVDPMKAKRLGTNIDCERLTRVLASYSFDLRTFNDLTKQEIMEELKAGELYPMMNVFYVSSV